MLEKDLLDRTRHLSLEHISLSEVIIKDDKVILGKDEYDLEKTGRSVIERYVGLSEKFKKSVSVEFRDQLLNKIFQSKSDEDATLVFNGNELVNFTKGTRQLVPLNEIFETVNELIPDGEVSLFKTDGLFTEFAVTTDTIQGNPTYSTKDVTKGGIYLKAECYGRPRVTVVPILHRMVCSNQMSQEQKNSALKVSGTNYAEILPGLSDNIREYMDMLIPGLLNRWLGLADYHPENPQRFATYLMKGAKLGDKNMKKVTDNLWFLNKPSAYEIINVITELQHNVSDYQRDAIWRLGARALTLADSELIACDSCKVKL
jgi:hypothetical protein